MYENLTSSSSGSDASGVRTHGLGKRFGELWAPRNLELDVPAGSILGLLGHNGAGKTTAIRILTTLSTPSEGSATVAGFDVATHPLEVRERIGVAAQQATVDGLMSARKNLVMVGRLHHLSSKESGRRADELLERLDLTDASTRLVKTFSGGMRRRLDLAASLVARPSVLFLDEPTTGLDPRSRQALWTVIEELVADGVTVFLTTQYLDEADRLADRIGVIDAGRIVAEGTAAELKRRVAGPRLDLVCADAAAYAALAARAGDRAVLAD